MPVAIKGSGGGSVTLDAGAAAADTTLTLPNTTGAVINTAPGTAGNVLTSTGSAWASTAPAATASLTLLATLTTTSGTTQSVTGLATTYTNLLFVCEGVNNTLGNTGGGFAVLASVDNGSSYGATSNIIGNTSNPPFYGSGIIFRANASLSNRVETDSGYLASGTATKIVTTSAAPINALRFLWNSGNTFNGGAIYIYGWN